MKTLHYSTLFVAALAMTACHSNKRATHTAKPVASVDPETRDGARQMEKDIERDTKDAAAGADQAADDFTAAIEGDKKEVDRDAATVSDAGEKAADDTKAAVADGADAAGKAAEKTDAAAKDAASDGKKTVHDAMDKTAATADDVAKKTEPKKVSAEVENIDRHSKQITFRVRDDSKEIQLVAGREMKIDFAELPVLTGMKIDEAISKMHEGQDVDLKVLGAGSGARIVRVNVGDF